MRRNFVLLDFHAQQQGGAAVGGDIWKLSESHQPKIHFSQRQLFWLINI
jgi:hypothetical protein